MIATSVEEGISSALAPFGRASSHQKGLATASSVKKGAFKLDIVVTHIGRYGAESPASEICRQRDLIGRPPPSSFRRRRIAKHLVLDIAVTQNKMTLLARCGALTAEWDQKGFRHFNM
ncbi:hypothetical protein LJR235_001111 [Pararhizobium sp. LjRoot235]|uniref:hypothetical protein n=1 Tax=Pararhizobium sp. LjRoot235 TaxID=3342291 RepID=UPI003ECFDA8F